ncbi:peptidase [Photorhabdus luminescens]|uniref:Prepilin-type N-terminal cleavage/methylation domain-containing protein n=1 Tax=Photorhabdus luminescens subsp. mexicana TaxID=2100167 RepID=A0A4R4J6T6_PHOLU|nr:prepilin peptidase-dependent protein [Photorhabdus luminescens]OWO81052.1 peptidase [Photorhabdus luminescens]TDB48951.1 prepilin-type N-terminal cleavage/methylation domain-containing protein [Photorhabdus luminescens subsp. mexicana]
MVNNMNIIGHYNIDNQLGFSLLELMIVIVLVSIFSLWGVQEWGYHQERARLQDSAQKILTFITRQQSLANYLNKRVVLWLKIGKDWCIALSNPVLADCDLENVEGISSPYQDIIISSATKDQIEFHGIRNTMIPASFILANSAGEISIIFSSRGRIRSCSNNKFNQIPACD